MKPVRPKRINNKVPVMSASEAVSLIPDGSTVSFIGASGGILEATEVINAIADRHKNTGEPKNLVFVHSTGLGDRGDLGMSPLARPGLVKRIYGGHWAQSPRLSEMADNNQIEAYNIPQGILSQLYRATAAHQPGIISEIGLDTFIDPRQMGGKLNSITTEDYVQLMELNGKNYLFYPSIKPDVAILRGTTADTEGYISMEDEALYMDTLAIAEAVHNNGGVVIMQVQRLVRAGSLHPRQVKVPGFLVDALVVIPNQPQLYNVPINRFVSGDFIFDPDAGIDCPLDHRKAVARRAVMEAYKGAVGNVGIGIADGIGVVAREEGISDDLTLTLETGAIGGITMQGHYFGAGINSRMIIDMPAQFDFYHGGGLDVCYLSFAELDEEGNVNVHRFNHKIAGTGGFIDISQNSKKLVFCGTLTAGGLKTRVGNGKLEIINEGKFKKLIKHVDEITFNGKRAARLGKEVVYITERAVFRLTIDGLCLTEVAPGIDIKKDVLSHMEFAPIISPGLKEMDERIFTDGLMGYTFKEAQMH